MAFFQAQGTGQDAQQKVNGHIGGKRGSTNHTQNSMHDTSSNEEEAKTGAMASNHGDIPLVFWVAIGTSLDLHYKVKIRALHRN